MVAVFPGNGVGPPNCLRGPTPARLLFCYRRRTTFFVQLIIVQSFPLAFQSSHCPVYFKEPGQCVGPQEATYVH